MTVSVVSITIDVTSYRGTLPWEALRADIARRVGVPALPLDSIALGVADFGRLAQEARHLGLPPGLPRPQLRRGLRPGVALVTVPAAEVHR